MHKANHCRYATDGISIRKRMIEIIISGTFILLILLVIYAAVDCVLQILEYKIENDKKEKDANTNSNKSGRQE